MIKFRLLKSASQGQLARLHGLFYVEKNVSAKCALNSYPAFLVPSVIKEEPREGGWEGTFEGLTQAVY